MLTRDIPPGCDRTEVTLSFTPEMASFSMNSILIRCVVR